MKEPAIKLRGFGPSPSITSPADTIALKATEFISECMAHSLNISDIHEILTATLQEYGLSGSPEKDFLTAIRRQQVINKVASTCERLRRGESKEYKQGEIKTKV